MKLIKLGVTQVTPSQNGTRFVTKLVGTKQIDLGLLGVKEAKRTFYISATKQAKIDDEIELDLDLFNIVARDSSYVDEDTNEPIMINWLHLK